MTSGFRGLRLLIVENAYFLDDDTADLLRVLGARITRVDGERMDVLDLDEVDAVIIDLALPGERMFALTEQLDEAMIPFVIATNDAEPLPALQFRAFRLCADRNELRNIADGLFKPFYLD